MSNGAPAGWKVVGDSPPGWKPVSAPEAEVSEERGLLETVAREYGGALETGASIASGMVAEPVAGLAGIAQSVNPFAEPGAGARAVEDVQSAMTYEPRLEEGQRNLQAIGEPIQAVGEFFTKHGLTPDNLGEKVLNATDSPAMATIARTIPQAGVEWLSRKFGGKVGRAAAQDPEMKFTGTDEKLLREGAPDVDTLFDASRAIFDELEELGATIKPNQGMLLGSQLENAFRKVGGSPRTTRPTWRLLEDYQDRITDPTKGPLELNELMEFRTVAKNLAKSNDPAQAAPAIAMIDTIDDFIAKAEGSILTNADKGTPLALRYKAARQLWGRARKTQELTRLFEKASDSEGLVENQVRTRVRALLNNDKKIKLYNDQEVAALKRIAHGTKQTNWIKTLGDLGFSSAQGFNILRGSIAPAVGATMGGTSGAVWAVGVTQAAKKASSMITRGRVGLAEALVKAGPNAKKIVTAYRANTPKNKRSVSELADLLLDPNVDIAEIGEGAFAIEAANLAAQRRGELMAVMADIPTTNEPLAERD